MNKDSAAVEGSATLIVDAPLASSGGAMQASPYKSAAEELDTLRKTFRSTCQHYAKRIDMEIIRLRERVAGVGEQQMEVKPKKKPAGRSASRDANPINGYLHDARDMITLLRTLEVKPSAGRRKDLKKIESLVDDLRSLVERWG